MHSLVMKEVCSDLKAQGFSGRPGHQRMSSAASLHAVNFLQSLAPSAPNPSNRGQLGEAVPQSQAAARGKVDDFVFCLPHFPLSRQKLCLIDGKGFVSFL